jgi:hypothetical protein
MVAGAAQGQLTLVVDDATGAASIFNDSATSISFDSYQIESTTGSLRPDDWLSLQDQGFAGWAEGGASNENILLEINLTGDLELFAGTSVSLGEPVAPGAIDSLSFRYRPVGAEESIPGNVIPEPASALLVAAGLGGILMRKRNRRKAGSL